MNEIKLGSKVRDTITGFTGIAIARTEFLNGCIRIMVQPQSVHKETGKPHDPLTFDFQQIETVEPPPALVEAEAAPAATPKKRPGGPYPEPMRNPDPS